MDPSLSAFRKTHSDADATQTRTMSLPFRTIDEAAMRALDRESAAPDSSVSKRIVAQLAAKGLSYKAGFVHDSCIWGLGNLVRCALEARVSADLTDAEDFHSPLLCVAAYFAGTSALKAMLVGGATKDLGNQHGQTALSVAARQGKLSCLQLLLDAGVNSKAQDDLGNTPLMTAAMHKQVECARALLPASNVAQKNCKGQTAFHTAVFTGSEACFELLLPMMSDVDVRTVPGVHPANGVGYLQLDSCIVPVTLASCPCARRC